MDTNGAYFFFCFFLFPQQRSKLIMGSSAQIGFGVCRCGWQALVAEGSGRFRKFQVCAGAKVPQGCGACCRRFRKVPQGSGNSGQNPGAMYMLLLLVIPPKLI